jgi:hypothetical protein
MTKDEALKLALEALESDHPDIQLRAQITLRAVLAQPVQHEWVGLTAEQIASIPLNEHTLQTAEKLLKDNNA